MSTQPFEIERTYNAPAERVWKAITDKDLMKQWYFDVPAFKPEVGTEFEFRGGPPEKSYRHLCVVKEVTEGKKISYSWRYDGYEGDSLVTFELFPEGENRTRVKLTHEGLETFPASNPDLAAKNFAEGWNAIIGTNLPKFVDWKSNSYTVEFPTDPAAVWNILTDRAAVKEWAGAFGEGIHAETDWEQGSEVVWMNGSNEMGVKGIVEENEPQKVLRTRFFDNAKETDLAKLGEYIEEFRLSEHNGKTELKITSGPLPQKEYDSMSPMWDKAIERMKALAAEK